jgi:hypothetical protein
MRGRVWSSFVFDIDSLDIASSCVLEGREAIFPLWRGIRRRCHSHLLRRLNMPCNPFVVWNPVPPGSRVCAKLTSDGDDFIGRVRIVDDGGGQVVLGTAALLTGTCVDLEHRGYAVQGTVAIGDEAPSVTLEMSIEGPGGDTLFACDWEFSAANTTTHVIVTIVPTQG